MVQNLGRVLNEMPDLYDQVRPDYPNTLFADLAAITGPDARSAVLEVRAAPPDRRPDGYASQSAHLAV
ncbi:hypothetical protein OHA72_10920 [Dactylosporangium sp. NBC_01737]|uniref:hypothetical protein n=1 Tax=Dactylosporangium sp. NBC_01737 TaxID=2975959 RepID=UPI002E13058A|nr:hypothetical protein OHA72_10920 [Dactylosporangium sp. NBC_01737]